MVFRLLCFGAESIHLGEIEFPSTLHLLLAQLFIERVLDAM